MKKIATLSLIGMIGLMMACGPSGTQAPGHVIQIDSVQTKMRRAALLFLQNLDTHQKGRAQYTLDDPERFNWHFFPKVRGGLPLKEMTIGQREQVMDLLRTGLSDQGFKKAEHIMQLEVVLQELENLPVDNDVRNPLLYYLAIFGNPAGLDPWGWRFEGHHISLNYTSVEHQLSITPAFFGTNPAIVPSGRFKGKEVMRAEKEMARELMFMLDEKQLEQAIISEKAPMEMLTFVDQKIDFDEYEGLAIAALSEVQMAQFMALLRLYIHNMPEQIGLEKINQFKERDPNEIFFAWMGGLGEKDFHYYRIHSPDMLIEYDNAQNEGNHIHTVWREAENDFGRDLLREHLKAHHK